MSRHVVEVEAEPYGDAHRVWVDGQMLTDVQVHISADEDGCTATITLPHCHVRPRILSIPDSMEQGR